MRPTTKLSESPMISFEFSAFNFIEVNEIVFDITFEHVKSTFMRPIFFFSELFISIVFYPFVRPYNPRTPTPKKSSLIKSLSKIAKVILFSLAYAYSLPLT